MRFSEHLKIAAFQVFLGKSALNSQIQLVYEESTGRFEKMTLVSSQTSRRSSNFKGHFSNSFPCNFENIRRNFISVGENRVKVRESQKKVRESCKICWTNDFELKLETLFSS